MNVEQGPQNNAGRVETPPTIFERALTRLGLDEHQRTSAYRIGRFLGTNYPIIAFLIGTGVRFHGTITAHGEEYDGITLLAQSLMPEPEFKPHDTLNNDLISLGWFGQYIIGGLGEVVKYARERDKADREQQEDIRRTQEQIERRREVHRSKGELENPYEFMTLVIDTTNQKKGDGHGYFYKELAHQSRLTFEGMIIAKFGHQCELVQANTPRPETNDVYFRYQTLSDRTFLQQLVHAERARASIAVLLPRRGAVWHSYQRTPIGFSFDDVIEFNTIIQNDIKAPNLSKKIVVVNAGLINQEGKASLTHYGITLREQRYGVLIAEQEVMAALKERFKLQGYHRILLIDDGTRSGEKFSGEFLEDYNTTRSDDEPEIVHALSLDEYKKATEDGNFDAAFLMGDNPKKTGPVVGNLLRQIEESDTKPIPVEILTEERDDLDEKVGLKINKLGGKIHCVYEILARRSIAILASEESPQSVVIYNGDQT